MKFIFYVSLLLLQFINTAKAQQDSNVVINNATDKYEIKYNIKLKRVEIIEKSEIQYKTNKAAAEVNFAEFYDKSSKISNVKYVLDKKSNPYSFKPEDSFYQSENIFYSDARVVFFSLTLPKITSQLTITYDKLTDDPRYFTTIYFTENYDLSQKIVEIIVPKWFKYEIKEFNFEGYSIEKKVIEKDGNEILTYTLQNLVGFKKEELSRGISYTYPHILLMSKYADGPIKETYFTDLQKQYDWYKSLIVPDSNATTVKEKALEITQKAKTDSEKRDAVYYWIQDNVRYIAFEDGIAGFKPALASDVLSKKYGDCKGMANLCCQMLKSLGFDARLCWLGTYHLAYNYSTPALCVDNHMICAVMQNGKPIFIDPTETYLAIADNAERIQGREVLIENGADFIRYKNPERPSNQNLELVRKEMVLEGTDLVGKSNFMLKGESRAGFLSSYNGIKSNKSEQELLNYLAVGDANYQITLAKQPDFKSHNNTIDIDYSFRFKNAASVFDGEIYIDLDHDKDFMHQAVDTLKRKSDVFFTYKNNIKHDVKLKIPNGFKLKSKPTDLNIDNPYYTLKANYTENNGYIFYSKQIIIKNTHINKVATGQFKKDFDALKNFYQETLILNK
jgi:transglutaminase-like putative cysteine protease